MDLLREVLRLWKASATDPLHLILLMKDLRRFLEEAEHHRTKD